MEEAVIKRILPHSIEAEQSVIGSMLMGREAIAAAMELIHADDFYQRQYGIMFEAITELYNQGKPVDLVTIQDRLKSKNVPPDMSSLDFIREIMNVEPISANVRHYARIVYEKSLMRRMIKLNEEIANACYAADKPVEEILDLTEKKMFDLLQKRGTRDLVPIRDVVIQVIDDIEKASQSKSPITGIPTGFLDLDYKLSGLHPSELILIAARPSMGKTALVLNLAEYLSVRNSYTTAIFSLEMSKEQLVSRILSVNSHVDSQKLRTGRLSDNDWDAVVETSAMIANSRLILDDTPGISVGELRSKCRKYKLEYHLDCIMIDYLQLMTGNTRTDSRQQEISEISRNLKALARELDVPIIALSQLSRACESRTDHRPMLSDLRESGAIEQDADVVMFLYRDDYYNKDTNDRNIAEIIVAKQRNGPIGTIRLAWLPELTKFANIENPRREEENR